MSADSTYNTMTICITSSIFFNVCSRGILGDIFGEQEPQLCQERLIHQILIIIYEVFNLISKWAAKVAFQGSVAIHQSNQVMHQLITPLAARAYQIGLVGDSILWFSLSSLFQVCSLTLWYPNGHTLIGVKSQDGDR